MKNEILLTTEELNQIKIKTDISEKDLEIINMKPKFPFLSNLWFKVWLFFNKIR